MWALLVALASLPASAATTPLPIDNQAPTFDSGKHWPNGFTVHVPLGGTVDPQLRARDFEDGDLTAGIVQSGAFNPNVPGTYRLTYTVQDRGKALPATGPTTSTYALDVRVFDPQIEVIPQAIALDALWAPEAQGGSGVTLNAGQSIRRTVRVDPDALTAPTTEVSVTGLRVKETRWGGNDRRFWLEVKRKDNGHTVYSASTTLQAGTSLALSAPLKLAVGVDYEVTLQYHAGPYPQGFTSVAGTNAWWLEFEGTQTLALFPHAEITAPRDLNRLAWDPGLATNLKAKLLSTDGFEVLQVAKRAGAPALTYQVADGAVANVAVTSYAGGDRLMLFGRKAGETSLHVLANGQVVDVVRLIVTQPKTVLLSYSYIAFPGEPDSHLKTAGPAVTRAITRNFAPYNIRLLWADHGVLTHEWDANGDGESYDPTQSERWSALDRGVIPDPEAVFSNLYMLRAFKAEQACGSNGNGSSRGMGPRDAAPRGAYKGECSNNAPSLSTATTLTHELGHNLGLQHYEAGSPNREGNFMAIFRESPKFYMFQWRTMHDTLTARAAAGDAGIDPVAVTETRAFTSRNYANDVARGTVYYVIPTQAGVSGPVRGIWSGHAGFSPVTVTAENIITGAQETIRLRGQRSSGCNAAKRMEDGVICYSKREGPLTISFHAADNPGLPSGRYLALFEAEAVGWHTSYRRGVPIVVDIKQ